MTVALVAALTAGAVLAVLLALEARATARWRRIADSEHDRAKRLRASLVTLQLATTHAATRAQPATPTEQEETDAREP